MQRLWLVIALSATVLLLSAAFAAPAEAQWAHCDCMTCKKIGQFFPIYTCWPQLQCNSWGYCTCNDAGNVCRLTGSLCFNDCITVT